MYDGFSRTGTRIYVQTTSAGFIDHYRTVPSTGHRRRHNAARSIRGVRAFACVASCDGVEKVVPRTAHGVFDRVTISVLIRSRRSRAINGITSVRLFCTGQLRGAKKSFLGEKLDRFSNLFRRISFYDVKILFMKNKKKNKTKQNHFTILKLTVQYKKGLFGYYFVSLCAHHILIKLLIYSSVYFTRNRVFEQHISPGLLCYSN